LPIESDLQLSTKWKLFPRQFEFRKSKGERQMKRIRILKGFRLGFFFVAVAFCTAVWWPVQGISKDADPGVISPNASYGGRTLAEWNVAYIYPVGVNGNGFQTYNVYALPLFGATPEAPINVTVPAGKAVLVMVLGTPDPDKQWVKDPTRMDAVTVPYSLADFKSMAAQGKLSCEIDGRAVQNLQNHVVAAPLPAPFWIPEIQVQFQWALGCYVMFAPLTPGTHTIHVLDVIPEWGYWLDVTYNLTVE
jgi:hypothetical protein